MQYVLRPNLNFRGFSGTIASGILRKGDEVVALPSGKRSKVKSIVTYDGELDEAFSPQAVTVTLEDEIDVSRGDMLVHPGNEPHVSAQRRGDGRLDGGEAVRAGPELLGQADDADGGRRDRRAALRRRRQHAGAAPGHAAGDERGRARRARA